MSQGWFDDNIKTWFPIEARRTTTPQSNHHEPTHAIKPCILWYFNLYYTPLILIPMWLFPKICTNSNFDLPLYTRDLTLTIPWGMMWGQKSIESPHWIAWFNHCVGNIFLRIPTSHYNTLIQCAHKSCILLSSSMMGMVIVIVQILISWPIPPQVLITKSIDEYMFKIMLVFIDKLENAQTGHTKNHSDITIAMYLHWCCSIWSAKIPCFPPQQRTNSLGIGCSVDAHPKYLHFPT